MTYPADIETAGKSVELDYGLQSTFISGLNETQKLRIYDLTARASRELQRWAVKYPLVRRVRVWPLTLTVAAASPFASVSGIVSMARMNLWGFSVDDLFDEEIVPTSELRRRVVRYEEILNGDAKTNRERDTLAVALHDIREDLQQYRLFPLLQDRWASAVRSMLNGMMQEHQWRLRYSTAPGTKPLPSYESYLNHSLFSIGVAAHFWTMLIVLDDSSTIVHLDWLREMERTTSMCIRLSNDLQSYAKEVSEGKINSIVIRQREAMAQGFSSEDSLQLACNMVQQDIHANLVKLTNYQREARSNTGHPERAIADLARFVCDFYVNHDYHTLNSSAARI